MPIGAGAGAPFRWDVWDPETMRTERVRRYWDRTATRYDERVARVEEHYLVPSRRWVCERAVGEVLEVAVGSGLNLPHYAPGVKLTGVDLSEGMLQLARGRATTARCGVELLQADGAQLPFEDESFDAVVCTFSLCGFPDPRAGVKDMIRVLRPGGSLLLADHVGSTNPLIRLGQWALQAITIPIEGEHWTGVPSCTSKPSGFPSSRPAGCTTASSRGFTPPLRHGEVLMQPAGNGDGQESRAALARRASMSKPKVTGMAGSLAPSSHGS